MDIEIPADLAAALRDILGTVTIEGLTRLPGGASRETWSFDAVGTGGSRTELVLRRDPPGRPGEPGAYRAAGGADITPDELRWWKIFGTLRWGVICMTQAQAHLSGAHRSVELAAVGRRVCEQEWDLLLLLAPDAAAEAAARRPRVTGAAQPAPSPHGRPTASELLEAVREFLTGQVMPASTGQFAFHARVAANILGIVARELELGAIPPEAGLADGVAAKLAVANPRYFDTTPETSPPAPPAS